MNNKLLSKICATLLSFMMVVSFMPYQVFATDEQPVDTGETVEETQDTDVIAEEPAVEEPAAPEAAESAAEENSEPADTAEEPKQELKEEPQDIEPLTFKTEKQSATPDVQLKDNDALLIEYLKKNISGEK